MYFGIKNATRKIMAVDFVIIILSFVLGANQGNIREGRGRKV